MIWSIFLTIPTSQVLAHVKFVEMATRRRNANMPYLTSTDACVWLLDGGEPEVISTAEFHPSSCSLLAYGSSSGLVRLVDLRRSALCDQSVRT